MTIWEYLDRQAERRLKRGVDTRALANAIGIALVAGFLGSLIALFIVPIKAANKELITYMLGQLSGFTGGVVAYHYAASASNRERTQQVEKALDVAHEATKAVGKAAE